MDKLWYIHVMEYYIAGKELLLTYSNLDGLSIMWVQKPVLEDYILHDSIVWQSGKEKKQVMKNISVVARSWGSWARDVA